MTVKELIEKLKTFPEKAEIAQMLTDEGFCSVLKTQSVCINSSNSYVVLYSDNIFELACSECNDECHEEFKKEGREHYTLDYFDEREN